MVSNTFVTSLGPDVNPLLCTLPVGGDFPFNGRTLRHECAPSTLLRATVLNARPANDMLIVERSVLISNCHCKRVGAISWIKLNSIISRKPFDLMNGDCLP